MQNNTGPIWKSRSNSNINVINAELSSTVTTYVASTVSNPTTTEESSFLNENPYLAVLPTPLSPTSPMAVVATVEELKWSTSSFDPATRFGNTGNSINETFLSFVSTSASPSTHLPSPKASSTTNPDDGESVAFILIPLILVVAIALVSGIVS